MNSSHPAAGNPLLDFRGLARFDEVVPAHVSPAVEQLLAENRATVAQLEDPATTPTWANFIEPLEDVTEKLARAWKTVDHMNAVVDTPELRAVHNENLPKVTEFWTALSQNLNLFKKYKALSQSAEHAGLTPARKRVIENALRDFRLGGAELPEDQKPRFAEIQEEQAALAQKFSENVLDATNDFALYIEDASELAGLPQDALAAARARAESDSRAGYKITLHMPSYLAVMQFAENRELREKLYEAYSKRASEFSKPEWDNSEIIVRTLQLRAEEAHMLGYKNYAELSLVPKMAATPDEVLTFLGDLAVRAKPYGQRDMDELRAFARSELRIADLQAWDITYTSEKLRERRYSFSEQEVKQYFPEPKVVEGLFRVVETLFEVHITPEEGAPVWHPDVKFYRVEAHDGQLLAQFYLDLYARPGKRSGAWMDDARTRRRLSSGDLQTPIAFLTCNFSEPVTVNGVTQPALFSHDEVITLFHEFGHGLHHMLTRIEDLPIAGINGVEWDAVELPSQFMENFCWEWDVVKHMTGHIETKLPLPKELFDKMLAAKNFQVGLQTLRQIEFSMFDMRLHEDFDPVAPQAVTALLNEVRARVAVNIPPPYNRFQNQFTHIFAGGYAAGYYSYKWAEVLSADAYAQFEEDGVLNAQTGARFRDEILSTGGSRPAMESFRSFRGRAPSIDALLRHNGMTVSYS